MGKETRLLKILITVAALAAVFSASPAQAQPCEENNDCFEGEYCSKAVRLCDGIGTCAPVPDDCPPVWDPVCGCDGQTYGNSCFAAMVEVSLDYEGECGLLPCQDNSACDQGDYCFLESCRDGAGTCLPMPETCLDVWDPVCACDRQTYSNSCYAAMAGVSVDYEGECGPLACWDNDSCGLEEYCRFDECAAETGACALRPESCLDVWDPVCACDGRTYSNPCYAAMAGASVDYEGECGEQACWDNGMCAPGEYCLLDDCLVETGACALRPTSCPPVWDPVCGCDGATYGNACYAAMAGLPVDYAGECSLLPCIDNSDCAPDDYCVLEECSSETGTCEPRPGACPDVWDPVCGCDSVTYRNACYAAMAGLAANYQGKCVFLYRGSAAAFGQGWRLATFPLTSANDDETSPFPVTVTLPGSVNDTLPSSGPLTVYRLLLPDDHPARKHLETRKIEQGIRLIFW